MPFDGYQNYGIRNSLRGYAVGKYKGKNMVAAQAEYRWRFYKKWGMLGFAGIGSVWGNDSEEEAFEQALLPRQVLVCALWFLLPKRLTYGLIMPLELTGIKACTLG
ncbi:MAG: hypothetical protein WBN11_07280 [Eudoraea sp.]|uniref:hypothetical protein n=1 Tax=Eudoraea sp. TaxID=1979955 RepID=UPI003C73E4FD